MPNTKIYDRESRIITVLTIVTGIIGLLIFLGFLYSISYKYSIRGTGEIDMTATSQVGDFVGGIVGSIWAITAILLFYLALILNRKEFSLQREQLMLQREELKKQNIEFQLNRITNIAYKQIEICDNTLNIFEVRNPDTDNKIHGREAINIVSEEIRNILDYNESLSKNADKSFDIEEIELGLNIGPSYDILFFNQWLKMNLQELIKLTDTVYNSCQLLELLLSEEIEIDNSSRNQLKTIFFANLGKDVDIFFKLLLSIINNNNLNLDNGLIDQIKHINQYQKFKYKK